MWAKQPGGNGTDCWGPDDWIAPAQLTRSVCGARNPFGSSQDAVTQDEKFCLRESQGSPTWKVIFVSVSSKGRWAWWQRNAHGGKTYNSRDTDATQVSVNQGADKEDAVHIYSGVLLSHKREIMPFAATWMDLETVTLSKVTERQASYEITYR